MELRQYQKDLVDSVWSKLFIKNKQLVVASCGAGKTECFISLCKRAIESKPDIRILILLNKVMLVEQTVRRLSKVIPSVGIYCGTLNKKEIRNVTVASIQSIKNVDLDKINMVILDEAHNVSVKENTSYGMFLKKAEHEKLKIIGFTATPYRESSPIYGEGKFFDCLDYEIKIEHLLSEGYLVRPTMKGSDLEFDTRGLNIVSGDFDNKQLSALTENNNTACIQVKDALSRLTGRKKTAWACATIKHSELVSKELENAGLDIVLIHSQIDKNEQDRRLNRFTRGTANHLVFVSMLSEGIDIPSVDSLVFLRPTRSIVRYIQTVGRVMRPSQGKENALILDYGQVVKNCGPINKPFIRKGNERKRDLNKMKVCIECFEIIETKYKICPVCEYEFEKKKRSDPKLTSNHESSVNILGANDPMYFECGSVKLAKHISKNGNECIKISYYSKNLLQPPIIEYFSVNHHISIKNLSKRLLELGCEFFKNTDEQVTAIVKNIPSQILFTFDGKYNKINKLIFNRSADG